MSAERGTLPPRIAYASLLQAVQSAGTKRGRHRTRLGLNALHGLAVRRRK